MAMVQALQRRIAELEAAPSSMGVDQGAPVSDAERSRLEDRCRELAASVLASQSRATELEAKCKVLANQVAADRRKQESTRLGYDTSIGSLQSQVNDLTAERSRLVSDHASEVHRLTSHVAFLQGHIDKWGAEHGRERSPERPETKPTVGVVPPMPTVEADVFEFSSPSSDSKAFVTPSGTPPGAVAAAMPPSSPSAPPADGQTHAGLLTFLRKPESEKISLPPVPSITSLRSWRQEVGKLLVAASPRNDTREIKWLHEVLQDGQTFAALADSGEARFHSLDLRLSAALSNCIRNAPSARALHDDLLVKEEQAQSAGTMLRGRQVLFMINEFF
jgi:hypothetical protein